METMAVADWDGCCALELQRWIYRYPAALVASNPAISLPAAPPPAAAAVTAGRRTPGGRGLLDRQAAGRPTRARLLFGTWRHWVGVDAPAAEVAALARRPTDFHRPAPRAAGTPPRASRPFPQLPVPPRPRSIARRGSGSAGSPPLLRWPPPPTQDRSGGQLGPHILHRRPDRAWPSA